MQDNNRDLCGKVFLFSYTAIYFMLMHYLYRKKRADMIWRRIICMNSTSTINLTDIELDPFDDAN